MQSAFLIAGIEALDDPLESFITLILEFVEDPFQVRQVAHALLDHHVEFHRTRRRRRLLAMLRVLLLLVWRNASGGGHGRAGHGRIDGIAKLRWTKRLGDADAVSPVAHHHVVDHRLGRPQKDHGQATERWNGPNGSA